MELDEWRGAAAPDRPRYVGLAERFAPLLPYLEPHATVHVMDRRGRGGSGDAPEYDLEREFEDVAAAVDRIAEVSDSKVDVYGHSYSGECAFGAALLTTNIRSLVLYEGWPPVMPEKLKFNERRGDPDRVAAALPDARIAVLEGQQHIADVLAPEPFAERVLEFLRRRP
jgi:pimeloyl-ACP methyl ester carboxylesterase